MPSKKAVSFRQAFNCEQGIGARCRCRCNGVLHGARRLGDNPTYLQFMTLAHDDAHRVSFKRADQLTIDDVGGGAEHAGSVS